MCNFQSFWIVDSGVNVALEAVGVLNATGRPEPLADFDGVGTNSAEQAIIIECMSVSPRSLPDAGEISCHRRQVGVAVESLLISCSRFSRRPK